jgi:4-amino-4-deoxy-L-arabinose transferase-like glycosyltransferase
MTHEPVTTQQSVATYDPEELRRYMVSQSNERLLAIVEHERAEYSRPALNLAEAELRLRGVPFTVPTPVGTANRRRRWVVDEIDRKVIWVLWLVVSFLIRHLLGNVWMIKISFGFVIAFLTIRTLFGWAERLLAKSRRGNHL